MSTPPGMEGLDKRRRSSGSAEQPPPRGALPLGQQNAALALRSKPAAVPTQAQASGEAAHPASIHSLPNELLHEVVAKLDTRSRHALMGVDKRFLAQGLFFEHKLTLDSPAALKAACKPLSSETGVGLSTIEMTSAHGLEMKLGNGAYTRADLEHLPAALLTSNRSHALRLTGDAKLDDKACDFLATKFPSLKEITLDTPSTSLSAEGLAALAKNPELQIKAVLSSDADFAAISACKGRNPLFIKNNMALARTKDFEPY